MEGEDSSASGLCKPPVDCESPSCDGMDAAVGDCKPIAEIDDSQLVGVSAMVAADSVSGGGEAPEVKTEIRAEESGGGKKKRGRPPRGQARPPPLKKMKEEEEEEDVCFICFDGGSLVLCDRRGCPKAYHPACIKRDEAFFRSKAKWNCGWHICSVCQKAAHYMCYTCTYSLCKACTKDADYLCVRENKGFCTTCMRTIMLIENNDQGNKEMPQVDFDDKSSWEYLFKVYWIYLKGKLSLTMDELNQAKNPWKAAGTVSYKGQPVNMHCGGNYGKGSISNIPLGQMEVNDSKSKIKEQPKLPDNEDSLRMGKSSSDKDATSTGSTEWASRELLDLVAHMKNGDTSMLSQFDVQSLLLDYIKRYNLRDPHRKSQIICDVRLKSLFGKPRVGHFEMLKLLEFHFPVKEDSRKDVTQSNMVDVVMSQVEGGGNNENLLMMGKDKKRKTRRKGEERLPQTNLDDYAAIDVHNINLIYLRRNLMESLFADNGKFHNKVVGSIVRIRISSSEHKQDMYRLVQVVGTCKAAVPYKIGEKTADVMLEILNLDKKETISMDVISNQEISEDECRRLRQSIKCGLVKRLTVGKVQEKAMELQEVRGNDWLETEVLRLNHLRDRASEKGRKKELRECVEKLELLKAPEERQRRLHEIPEVHADPKMDPNCESDEDAGEVGSKKRDEYVKPRFSRNGRKPMTSQNDGRSNSRGSRAWKKFSCEQTRSLSTKVYLDKGSFGRVVERVNESSWHEEKDARESKSLEKPGNQVDSSGSVVGGWNNRAVLRSGSFSGVAPETSISSLSTGSASPANDSETDKLWHYRDPNGKIQGPFCMVQLRKWSTTGYFPPDMRIWSINDEEVDSLLLTDVLNGKFHKVLALRRNPSLLFQEVKDVSDSRLPYSDDRGSDSVNTIGIEGKRSDRGWNSNNGISHSNCSSQFVKGDGWGSHNSNCTTPVANNNDVQTGSSSQCCDSIKVNSFYTVRQNETSLHQGKDHEGKRWNSGPNHGNWSPDGNPISQTTDGQSHDNRSDSRGYSGKSSGESCRRPLPINFSSNNRDSNSGVVSMAKATEQNFEIDTPNLPSPTPKTGNGDLESSALQDSGTLKLPSPAPELSDGNEKVDSNTVQDSGTLKLPSLAPELSDGVEKVDSNIPNLSSSPPEQMDGDKKVGSSIQNLPSPSLKPKDGDERIQAAENKLSVSSNFPVHNSGPSWSSASSLVVGGGTQCPEIAGECCEYSPTRAKPSVEEWDSGLGSVSSFKPPEVAADNAATPTSKCDQFTPSPSHPEINALPSWQVIVNEPIEFCTLDEESVSDLLAEVDAMESQCGLASPTSVMYSGDEFFQDSNNDCFTSISGLSPPLDSGKSDALSSTGDITLPHQSTMTDKPLWASQAGGQSSTSAETRSTDFSVDQSQAGSKSHIPASFSSSRDMMDADTDQRVGLEPMNTDSGTVQGNLSLGLGGSTQGITTMGWGTVLGTAQGNANMDPCTSDGVMGLESQPRYGGK
ncbi:LOW QUALITY PROTEIN: zinc finger CCCH domain-containing protein 44-like [Actinidia eriantha]|uniref:LOW QUALITY PROTEIN: zinc finger CCCH domain-containing protein 44-like n=1 Tax=Actinidia eriantha TaxID=165200 RepID=UPI002582DC4B|nr:LOW QUALITY PROTEIN: zinc finger CCCH domain-containing protein 44-like [Actinidia eriantha]